MNEFDKFRKAVITSLKEGHGAIISSYASESENLYYGGIALLKDLSSIKVNRRDSLQAKGIYVTCTVNTLQKLSWRLHVEHDAWLGWDPDSISYQVVFKVNNSRFVSEFKKILEKYSKEDILSQEQPRPYFLPMFTKPISRALSDGTIELLFPIDKVKRERAIKHLSFYQS
ncbi:MAG: hypothetical protein DRP00_03625 [Candidatus Aenigmatarchaeota archaeon]|nr:MAG: hypothetical protein DRP00_03625 [Candidatus Aenigmarchaeota archaeon]